MFHNSNCQTTSVSPEQCNSRRSAISIWCVGSIVLPECRGMQRFAVGVFSPGLATNEFYITFRHRITGAIQRLRYGLQTHSKGWQIWNNVSHNPHSAGHSAYSMPVPVCTLSGWSIAHASIILSAVCVPCSTGAAECKIQT